MKSVKNQLILGLLFFLLNVNVFQIKAQTPAINQTLTLEQCIDYALKNNIQIKQSELNTELTEINLTQSKANLLPSLNGKNDLQT